MKRGERRGNRGERRGSDVAPSGLLLRWENEYSCGSGWLCTLTNGTPYSIDSLSSGCSTFDLYAHHLPLTFASGESVCSIAQRRYSMNSKDYGVPAAEEYMYIAAFIPAISLFHIHCHMALTVLELPLIVKPSKDLLQPG